MTGTDVKWDGWVYPYMAPKELRLDQSVRLHRHYDQVVEPVNHEVLRHALWNVNVDHGTTIMRVSGSPAAAYGHDFNPVLLDEVGDYVFNGPFVQYLSAGVPSGVKWTLENRAENPGIGPGDMYLTNDPWIGTDHQPDLVIMAPVFVEGAIFCWVGSSLHTWDLGGTVPGGFNPMAQDVYWEGAYAPPVRIVEAGVMRRDIAEHFTRCSRMPELVALDLRAMIAGARVASEEVLALVGRYGAPTVKATMKKLQDDSEAAFVRRLASLPEGTWTEEGWIESASIGDGGVYRNRVTVTKEGDRLVFTNYGSAEQIGTIGATYVAWRGAVISMLVTQLLFDQMFVIEGAMRHCDFRVDPGLVSCTIRPGAVSGAPAVTLMNTIGLGGLAISKMLAASSDPALRTEAQSCMGLMAGTLNSLSGLDQRHRPYATMLMDCVGAALPAKEWGDGQDTGGWPWDLQSTMPDVESYELFYPILYLWRKELPDSGGAGRFRGGNSGEVAIVLHKSDGISMTTFASEMFVPGTGLFGGSSTSTNTYRFFQDTQVKKGLAEGDPMPTSIDQLGAEGDWVSAKAFDIAIGDQDVWVTAWASASGFGDPLLRDPAAVETDVALGAVSPEWATAAYAVVVGDPEATQAQRRARVTERLGHPPEHPITVAAIDPGKSLGGLLVRGADTICCASCSTVLSPIGGNYKDGTVARRRPAHELNPHVTPASIYSEVTVEAVGYLCPGCGVQLGSEVLVNGESPTWDVRLGHTDVEEARQR